MQVASAIISEVAGASETDRRTVIATLQGKPGRPLTRRRILRELKKRGIIPRENKGIR